MIMIMIMYVRAEGEGGGGEGIRRDEVRREGWERVEAREAEKGVQRLLRSASHPRVHGLVRPRDVPVAGVGPASGERTPVAV